nr:transposase [Enterococcus faecalis]
MIVCADNLVEFSDAIQATFPKTKVQKCIVHQIRNSIRFVGYKDLKAVTTDLKPIYKASTEELALEALRCIFITLLSDKKAFKYFRTSVLEESFGVPQFTKRIPVLFKIIHCLSNSIMDHVRFEPFIKRL